jgi:hypothetical protein
VRPRLRAAVLLAALLACLVVGVAASAGAGPKVAQAPRVSLAVPAKLGPKGAGVAKGAVAPAPAHGRVVLQLSRGGKWRALGHATLSRGHFKVRFRLPATVMTTRLRAVLFVGGHRVAVSPARAVRVKPVAKQPTPVIPTPPAPTPAPNPCPATFGGEDPLSAASLMKTVSGYASLPNHLSSTQNSTAALNEFSSLLCGAGLKLGQQAFAYPEFVPKQVALTIGSGPTPTAIPAAAMAPLLYSGTTGTGGTTGQLYYGGTGIYDKSQVAGRIVVVSIAYQTNSKALNYYPAIESAVEGGAEGLIAVTQAVGDYPKWEDVNARNGTGPLPVVNVGKHTGEAIITAAEAGETGHLTLTASTGTGCDRDVWGELPGAEPNRRVFVATPASSFTPSASEHGTGVAITVGLARHYAALPVSQRPATLVFMALGGHEIGWLGLQALMNSPQGPWFKSAEAYVHLGSGLGAPAAKEEPDGTIVTEAKPDPTGRLHDSENPLLEKPIIEDWEAAGVKTPETPPHTASGGEQTYAYTAGIPTVSFSGASLYFHTAGDVPSTIDPTILAKDADAFRRSVDTIDAIPPGALRAANKHAEELGAAVNPDTRAPFNATKGTNVEGSPLGSGGVGGPAAMPVASCP